MNIPTKRIRTYIGIAMVLALTQAFACSARADVPAFWMDHLSEPQTRRSLAEGWLEGITAVERAVPTLSPEQKAWLNAEYTQELQRNGGKYTQRSLKASESEEYRISVSRPRLEELEALLTTLSKKSPGDAKEARLWTSVAVRFMDHDLWQALDGLARSGTVSKRINGVDSLYFETHVLWAQILLNRGVGPMLDMDSTAPCAR